MFRLEKSLWFSCSIFKGKPCTTATAVIFIIKSDTRTESVRVHVDISVLKHARHTQQETARLHPLLSCKSSQKKHSKDSYYSICSSLVDTYYCLIWACFESVALNTGPGVILTSAVLRTSENSRIKVCVHWENANWLNHCAQHLLFSPACIRRTHQPFFCQSEDKNGGFFPPFCRTPRNLQRPLRFPGTCKDGWRVFAQAKQEVLFSSSVCFPGTKIPLGITICQGQSCQLCQMWTSSWIWMSISFRGSWTIMNMR